MVLKFKPSEVYIYSDSLSIDHAFSDDEIILQIFNYLDQLNNRKVFLGWIKVHVGLAGNERADTLSKSVTKEDTYDEDVCLRYP